MRKFFSALCAGALSLAMGFTGIVPATAGAYGSAAPSAPSIDRNVQLAQMSIDGGSRELRRFHRNQMRERNGFGSDRSYRGRDWRSDRREARRYNEWRGHRGYRDRRAGYRRHSDGFWYPLAAFAAGAAIGSAIGNSGASAGGRSHVNWCANRYRSYRASDNTFQPYNGPRQQCRSPY